MSLLKVNEVQNYNGSSLTLTASTVSTSAQLNTGGNISVTGSLNVSDDSTTRTNLGLGSMATQNANAVAITGGTINTVQPATGQSLTIKDEDGNTAITIGTDNTAAGYLSLNFGSYHGDSAGAGSGTLTGNTLNDYEEGSFTPVLADAQTGGNTASVGTETGIYTKIGRQVTCKIELQNIDTTGMTAGNAIWLRGLPFLVDTSLPSITRLDGWDYNSTGWVVVETEGSSTTGRFFNIEDNTTDKLVTVTQLNSGTADCFINLGYFV